MQNVINFDKWTQITIPDDLKPISELCAKYGYKYSYLYKWSVRAKNTGLKYITPYYFGGLKLSEKEVLNFDRIRTIKKYGRN